MARLKVALIFAVCAAPFVLAWAVYYFGWTSGTTANYGELIAPRTLSGAPFESLRGKWVLLTADGAACDAYCERKLYLMRQVRRAQGKDMGRVERLWLVDDRGAPREALVAALEGARVAPWSAGEFPRDYIFLVDPLGNLMMRFPRDPDGSRMIKDLQRLLRASSVG